MIVRGGVAGRRVLGPAGARLSPVRIGVARTALANVVTAGTAAVAGVVVARALGPAPRGEYAAIMAWFGALLVLGQLGQTAATTYFVAREPARAADYVATSRNLMVLSGLLTVAAGVGVAPVLGAGNEQVVWGYRLMFVMCLPTFVGASYTYALQAAHLAVWNVVRVSQPVVFLAAIGLLYATHRLSLMLALGSLCLAILVQAVLGYGYCRHRHLAGGTARLALSGPLARYGASQLTAAAPTVLTARLDQLVLSVTVAPAALGHYSVAASMTNLALPVVAAVGNVAFPRIAARSLSPAGTAALQRRAVLASLALAAALMLVIAGSATWVVPAVYGASFRDAVPLVWVLAPGGVALACGLVCADLLRGHGRPLTVAWAQGMSALLTAGLLAALLPAIGLAGAALASSAGAGVALVLMLRALARRTTRPARPSPGPTEPRPDRAPARPSPGPTEPRFAGAPDNR